MKYSVQSEAWLWHWRVFGERGIQLGHGATHNCVLSRAEAINFASDPARVKELARLDRRHLDVVRAKSLRVFVDTWNLTTAAVAELDALRARCAMSSGGTFQRGDCLDEDVLHAN